MHAVMILHKRCSATGAPCTLNRIYVFQ